MFYQFGMKKTSKCPASVVLTKVDDRWSPQNLSSDDMYNHASDRVAILADIMKKEMFAKVSKHPETKADDTYREVITDYEERYGEEEQVWDEAVANLPYKDQLARNMSHIRSKELRPLPKNRDEFDPEAVIKDAVVYCHYQFWKFLDSSLLCIASRQMQRDLLYILLHGKEANSGNEIGSFSLVTQL